MKRKHILVAVRLTFLLALISLVSFTPAISKYIDFEAVVNYEAVNEVDAVDRLDHRGLDIIYTRAFVVSPGRAQVPWTNQTGSGNEWRRNGATLTLNDCPEGWYAFEIRGGKGGDGQSANSSDASGTGGDGGTVKGAYYFSSGTITIQAGKGGHWEASANTNGQVDWGGGAFTGGTSGGNPGGGGGSSRIWDGAATSGTLVAVAGGGGGGGYRHSNLCTQSRQSWAGSDGISGGGGGGSGGSTGLSGGGGAPGGGGGTANGNPLGYGNVTTGQAGYVGAGGNGGNGRSDAAGAGTSGGGGAGGGPGTSNTNSAGAYGGAGGGGYTNGGGGVRWSSGSGSGGGGGSSFIHRFVLPAPTTNWVTITMPNTHIVGVPAGYQYNGYGWIYYLGPHYYNEGDDGPGEPNYRGPKNQYNVG